MEFDFPKLEEKILKRWKQQKAFEKSLKRRKRSPIFVFYEGPPTANGRPGMHHVVARAFKDVVCRYKTMRGFYVPRKAGWDTHGLPVELEVEKKLGLQSKKEIEKYGVGKFNAECKKSVWQYKKEWEDLTERIGFWLDQENPYITYEKEYMESLWWIIKQFAQKQLLYKGHKVVPYCPRCGTPLSSHELAQGYKTTKDRSVFVKFQITNSKSQTNHKFKIPNKTFLLAWTTTPWTLPGNVALAVGEKITYVLVKQGQETYILAKNLLEKLEGKYTIVKEISGKELEGIEYEPLFDSLKKQPEKKHYIAVADFVSTDEGTGIVHTAVMYGEDDYQLGQKLNLPKKHTVNEEGKFNELVPQWKGFFVKEAELSIIQDLGERGLLYKEELYEHEYPFCWRCSTPLLYYAKESWFVDMQKVKKRLRANNQNVNWIPLHLKNGRMGEWLKEVKDWAFSRERYWGTPLPVWECDECGAQEVVGSLEDLKKNTLSANSYYLLRHGESTKNKTNINVSWPEKVYTPLTPKGLLQARKAAKEIKSKKIDVILSSDLVRTKQTAEVIAKELGITVTHDKRLRESDMGVFNGKKVDDFGDYFRKEGETPFEHYMRRFQESAPKGETYVEIQKRLFDLMQDIEQKYEKKTILLVSHELPLTLLEGLLQGYTREDLVKFRMKRAMKTGEVRKVSAARFPYNNDMEIDLHRPYIDEIEFACTKCEKGSMKRVKDVVDVWFDSGAMPYAQNHWPFTKKLEFPADYITEAIDQTRGWFYTLLAVATLLGRKAPYKNVISLGHVLDEKGEKMSKSKGNIVNPWEMVEKYGVDTLRWYFFTTNHPWDSKAFRESDLQKTMRKFSLTVWNSLVFYKTYGIKFKTQTPKSKNVLDTWIISRLHTTIKETTQMFDAYDITGASRVLERFVVEDLSLWYIRRSRARFQNPKNKTELQQASNTLHLVLLEVSKLLAPFTPFLAEHIYGEVGGKESVHWQDWPHFAKATRGKPGMDEKIEEDMKMVLHLVGRGLTERAFAKIKVRQPLSTFKIRNEKLKSRKELLELIKDELNVKEVVFDANLKQDVWLDTKITRVLQKEGALREIVRHIQEMRKQAGYKPQDRAKLGYTGSEELVQLLQENKKAVMAQVGLKEITEGKPKKNDAEQEFSLDGQTLWLGIRKI